MNLRKSLALSLVLGAATTIQANESIIGGSLVNANDPVVSSTVLIIGKVEASKSASAMSALKKKPAPTPTNDPGNGSSGDPSAPQEETYICTGSLVDTDLVVTAAHCVATSPENIRVVFALDINNGAQLDKSQVLPITGYVANPGWQGDNSSGVDQHDIAVIRLSGSLPSGYHPANLLSADASAALRAGDQALLAGYGITNAKTQDGAGTLREVTVSVAQQLGQTEVVLDQRQGKGACHGDSGGPAFSQVGGELQLWGVTNRGYPDNASDNCKHYAVYTRISAYTDFINEAANQLRGKSSFRFF